MRYRVDLLAAVGVSLALAACGGTPRVANLPSAPGRTGAPVSDWPVKVGNPYQVAGVWYYPKDDKSYDEVGIASWYGPNFHGLSTANGENYDMDMVSAAHKTLPLPCYVEVTNLQTGKSLIVRVNDRGPFVGNRIIDLSRRSADLLGVTRAGTAQVRVRRVYPSEEVKLVLRQGGRNAQVQLASAAPVQQAVPQRIVTSAHTPVISAAPRPPMPAATQFPAASAVNSDDVRLVDLPASVAPAPATSATSAAVPTGSAPVAASFASIRPSFIQVAAVSDKGRASWLVGFLKPYGPAIIQPTGAGLLRVRLGPYTRAEDAQAVLAKVRNAGYQEARIVADGPAG